MSDLNFAENGNIIVSIDGVVGLAHWTSDNPDWGSGENEGKTYGVVHWCELSMDREEFISLLHAGIDMLDKENI